MPASTIHLVRHGEVHNPDGVLYGRLAGFTLSERGHRMAEAAAEALLLDGAKVSRLIASPLQRTQESAAPWSERFGLPVDLDERLIEPTNRFEGRQFGFGAKLLLRPYAWPHLRNPFRPSWGEPYQAIVDRMMQAIDEAWHSVDQGEVVLVSHQLPIWMVHRSLAGEKLFHDPRRRRCALSSITSIEWDDDRFVEVGYREPAAQLLLNAIDQGAV